MVANHHTQLSLYFTVGPLWSWTESNPDTICDYQGGGWDAAGSWPGHLWHQRVRSSGTRYRLKGTVSRDFLLQAFFHLPPVSTPQLVHLELRIPISANFRKKFETVLMVFSGAWGKETDSWKNLKSKSWHCPFKYSLHALGHKNKDFSSEVLALS